MQLFMDTDQAISILQDRIREFDSFNIDPQFCKTEHPRWCRYVINTNFILVKKHY